jgi:hypothetical protein
MEIKPFYSGRAYYDITSDNGEKYVFVPQEFVEKGFVQGGQQFYSPGFLTPGALSTASVFTLPSDSSLTAAAKSIYKEPTKGLVWKADDFNKINYDDFSFKAYDPTDSYGTIKGYAIKDGVPYYAQATAPGADYTLLDKSGTSTNTKITYTVTGGGGGGGFFADLGREILKAGPILPAALNFALPGLGTAVALGTAGGLAATGRPEAALSYGASALVGQLGVGSAVTGATGSTLAGQVASGTTAGLLTGKTPEEALKGGVVGAGAGVVGSTIAGETGSAAAGQLAAGTTAGLLTGKNVEQSLAQGVGNVKLDSLIPDSGVTVANEAQVAAGQTALQDSLAPFLKDTTASAFDTKDIIDDSSGFSTTTTAPVTIDSGVINPAQTVANVVGTDATKIDTTQTTVNTGVKAMDDETGTGNDVNLESVGGDPYALLDPVTGEYFVGADDQNYDAYTATLSDAIKDYATGTGLSIRDAVKFFKDNPNLAKAATSVISSGVGLFGTKLATDTATTAAKTAADAMKFKPVGVTTRFGTTDYTYDAEGNLKTAGYTLTPELKAIQDKLMTGATLSLDEAKKVADLYDPLKKASASLFDLGTSYLAKTPEQVAADYMAKQQDLLAPSRERQLSQLQNTLFQTGRGGLSVGGTGLRPGGGQGLRAASPEMEAYYNALAQSDAALAAGAQQAGQQSVLFGKGLLGSGGEFLGKYTAGQTSAYDPFKTLLSTAGTVEGMGGGALDIGTALGGRRTTAAGNAASTLLPTASRNPYASLFTSLADDPSFKTALQDFISGGSSGIDYGTASRANDVNTPF